MPGVSAAASLSNALRTSRWNGVAARHSTSEREKYSAVISASVKPVSSSRRNARCSSVQNFLPSCTSSNKGNPADCSASRSRRMVRVETPVRSAEVVNRHAARRLEVPEDGPLPDDFGVAHDSVGAGSGRQEVGASGAVVCARRATRCRRFRDRTPIAQWTGHKKEGATGATGVSCSGATVAMSREISPTLVLTR